MKFTPGASLNPAAIVAAEPTMSDKSDLLNQLKIDKQPDAPASDRRYVRMVAVAVGLVLLPISAWLIWGGESEFTVSTAMARVGAAGEAGGQIALQGTGYVTARRRATVSSKVVGKIDQVLVEEGDSVEAGQVVARLDDSNVSKELRLAESRLRVAQAQLQETRAQLNEAELAAERARDLHERELISRSEYDSAEARYQSLQARLQARQAEVQSARNQIEVRQQNLEDLAIRAPFDGVVVAKNAQPGEMISPMASGGHTRTGICSLVDMSSLEIEVDVNEAYIDRVRPGQPVVASLDAYPDWRIPAKVAAIVPTADRQKATVRVRVAFESLDPRILPDMGIKVAFLEGDSEPENAPAGGGVLEVPATAVRERGGERVMFVVNDDNRAAQRRVKTRAAANGHMVITDGLQPGEIYVREIPEGLVDGATVTTN